MGFERHRRWNIFSIVLATTLLSLLALPAINSQENETNSSLPYIDPLVWQELNQYGWAWSLVTVNNSGSVDIVISGLPPSSFVLIEQTPENFSFSANISWQAFDVLANDTNVRGIYLEMIETQNQSGFSFSVYREGIAYITQAGVLIDAKIIEAFYSNNWTYINDVGLQIRTPENLTADYIKTFPMSQRGPLFSIRDAYFARIKNEIIANLSADELNVTESASGMISGSITKKGVEKLGSDPRIEFIAIPLIGGVGGEESNESVGKIAENNSSPISSETETEQKSFKLSGSVIFPVLLVIVIIILLLLLKNSQKRK